ncbi:MAG TPA: CYTH and CHAD domain-containing protein [Blastococcus sp.]|jgi:CHAD domain-containing protein|nr:CYTH and CHAD domain-containing protein [Blastococcus sp.]
MAGHLEIERKFDVGPDFAVPDLVGVAGVASVADVEEIDLAATYHDSADLRLLRSRVTLRRRTGGADAGWHVKLPGPDGARTELHQPLGRAVKAPPVAVLAPVRGLIGTRPVGPVATIETHRVVRRLADAEGRVLAEVADDAVTGAALATTAGAPVTITAWREIEVELVDGDRSVLDAVAEALCGAGARPSASASKVGQVLASRLADAAPPADERGKKRRTAGDVVLAAVRAQVVVLGEADLAVRAGGPEGVHDFRVACRRLRSIFAEFRPVLLREQTDPIRAELQWAGQELSATRDGEVALEHLRALVADQPVELVLGPVAARLQQAEIADSVAGVEHAHGTLTDRRYLRLIDALHDLLAAPQLTDLAAEPATRVFPDAVRHSGKRLRRAVRTAETASGPARHLAMHEVRKAAKRVRYTAEVAGPVLGGRAKKLKHRMKWVQTVLGDAQDTVVTRAWCTRLGLAAEAAGENAWTYGRLHALEEIRAERAEEAFWAGWPATAKTLKAATR